MWRDVFGLVGVLVFLWIGFQVAFFVFYCLETALDYCALAVLWLRDRFL